MDYSFNAKTFRDLFHAAIKAYMSETGSGDDINSVHNLVVAMDQAIDVMERADADLAVKQSMSTTDTGLLEEKDITKIGGYTLELLEGLVAFAQDKTDQQDRDLMRLSIPVSLWVARHDGHLDQIEIVVNSLAGYANEITDLIQLAELANIIGEIIEACSDKIKTDVEQVNRMRPWRILNLNYGIVATRSHNPALIEAAYDALVKNLSQDARQFFHEGMQQMDIIGYPQEVREVVERYDKMWGSESTLH